MSPTFFHSHFETLTAELLELAGRLPQVDETMAQQCQIFLRNLTNSTVKVTFGGHFSAGKTTLLNRLLRREMLPVDDLAETGVITLIGTGKRDSAVAYSKSRGTYALPCTREALRKIISLAAGSRVDQQAVMDIERLEVRFQNASIPPSSFWIDSPGIQDKDNMEERARAIAYEGDVLIWLLGSKQFLGLSEQMFLQEYMQQRSHHSMLLVENAFLKEDSPEGWRDFHRRLAPAHLERLHYFMMEELQICPLPQFIVVAARAIGTNKDLDYGEKALRHFLETINSAETFAVRHGRLRKIEPGLTQLVVTLEKRYTKWEASANIVRTHGAFLDALKRLQNKEFKRWHDIAVTSGANAATQLTNVTADVSRVRTLFHSELKTQATLWRSALRTEINNLAQIHKLPQILGTVQEEFYTLLPTPLPDFVVANTEMNMGTITGGGVAGGVGGSIIPGIGTLAGVIIGTIGGAVKAYNDSIAEDLELTKGNIRTAGKKAGEMMEMHQERLLHFVLQHCIGATKVAPSPFTSDQMAFTRGTYDLALRVQERVRTLINTGVDV